ncbi:pili assembly chaperone [Salmonella enterica]|nr:pili assembly chaperone [Salmonella enterica]
MKNNNVPLYLWLLWCTFCLYITTPWQYFRYLYTDHISLSYILYFCIVVIICFSPLLFRCVLLIVRSVSKYNFTFFAKKNGSKESNIHLSPYADTRCPESMRKHWDVLLSLISKAINNDETIVMHSHLFTPARINKLIKRLESYGLNFSVITCPRKTSLYEKLSIPFVYLLFQWSLPHLHSDGMTVVIRPLQPPHTN